MSAPAASEALTSGVDHTADGPSGQVLAARSDTSLREETVTSDGHARTWRSVTNQFEDYLMSQNAAAQTWHEEKGVRATSHRFTPEYADEQYGKIHGGIEWAGDNLPPNEPLTTVLITRTGWPYDGDGRPAPPTDYLDGLRDGRRACLRKLRDALDGHPDVTTWGRVSVREPHVDGPRAGYPHAHDGIVIIGEVSRSDLQHALDAYVDTNPFARERDHGPESLTVVTDGDGENAESLATELTNGLVGYEFGSPTPIADADDAVTQFSSLMWATNAQSVTPDADFREFVRFSQIDWEPDDGYTGVEEPDVDPDSRAEYVEPTPVDVAYTYPDEEDDP